jgi:secretion/DNA translocation related TadE-like protein
MTGRTNDRGSATIWVVVAALLVVAITAVVVAVGAAVEARHRAAAAADAAALAGALDVVEGPAGACGAARRLAAQDGAVLARCSVTGAVVDVSTRISLAGPLRWLGLAAGVARAGPDAQQEVSQHRRLAPTWPDFGRSGLRISRSVVP